MRHFGLKSKWCGDVDVFWSSRQDEQVFFLNSFLHLWLRNKSLIRPPHEFVSCTGLSTTFRALSHDRWTEPGFSFSQRFFFWWLVVCLFPFGSFCSEQICKGYYFIFPNSSLILILEYIIVLSSTEEPSKISPTLYEWPLSSVGRGTLQGGTGWNPVEAWIFPSGFSVSAIA